MKGLLIKDFKLLKWQKNFFLLIFVIEIGWIVFSNVITIPLGVLTFVVSLFALTTVSYDEFDNGNAFLFSLPFSRTSYVIEKYSFGLILGFGTWVVVTAIAVIATISKGTLPLEELVMSAFILLPFVFVLQAIMLPFQFKFGGEKGKIAIIGAIGIVAVIGAVIESGVKMIFNMDIAEVFDMLPTVSIGMVIGIFICMTVILFLISIRISISIMNKKEF